MKAKILNALKTEHSNLGLSDKAFDAVASFLEKSITDENDIVTRIKGDDVKALLKGFQGESDSLRNKNAQLQKDLDEYKKAHPESTVIEPDKHDDEWANKFAELQAEISETKKALVEAQSKANRETLISSVKAALLKAGAADDYVLKNVIKSMEINDADTVDSLSEKYKKVYDSEYVEAFGEGAVPRSSSKRDEGYRKGDNDDFVKEMQAEGLIPTN